MEDVKEEIHSFSAGAYVDLISALIAKGYSLCGYHEARPEQPHLILRHDIDFDLGSAVAMAELEANQDWHAHYFILIRTEFYNPLSATGSTWVRRILELGHTVGLHFDAHLYDPNPATLRRAIDEESAVLEKIANRPVNQFSLHRPHPEMLDGEFTVPGRVNAYAPRYFKDIGYCSDSRGEWRYGHPLDSDAVQSRRALQLLTHPLWWMDAAGSPEATVARVLDRRFGTLEHEADVQCAPYYARRETLPRS